MKIIYIAYVLFIVESLIREILRKGPNARKITFQKYDHASSLIAGLNIFAGFITPLIFELFQWIKPINIMFSWLGIILMIIGTIIVITSVRTLGKFFSRSLIIQGNHRIIKEGMYSFIRHPGYLGAILVWLGFGLGSGNLWSLIIIIFLSTIFYTYRIYWEEKMLIKEFGKEYKKYMQKTNRLIPYFY